MNSDEPRSRVRRRNVVLLGVAAAVAAVIVLPSPEPIQPAPAQPASAQPVAARSCSATNVTDPRMTRPTGGDLGGDTRFCSEVLRVWEQNLTKGTTDGVLLSDLVAGEPHVYWAGSTPAGRVAVVMQAMKTQSAGTPPAVGIVGIDAGSGQPAVLAADAPGHREPEEIGYRIGPEGRTVLILDRGVPLYLPGEQVRPFESDPATGGFKRTWQPMTVSDGVAIGQLPDDIDGLELDAIAGDPQHVEPASTIPLIVAWGTYRPWPGTRPSGLNWGSNPSGAQPMSWAGTEPDEWQDLASTHDRFIGALRNSTLTDPFAPIPRGPGSWYLSIGLPNGKTAIISEYHPGRNGPARLYAVVDNGDGEPPTVIYAGRAARGNRPPVLIKMPDGQGWAAAADGCDISFQTAKSTEWQGERRGALLIPPDATKVRVYMPGRQPYEVTIPAT